MKNHSLNLQDIMLNSMRREKLPVVLSSRGKEYEGTLVGFDHETLILNCREEQILFYKAGIDSVRVRGTVMRP